MVSAVQFLLGQEKDFQCSVSCFYRGLTSVRERIDCKTGIAVITATAVNLITIFIVSMIITLTVVVVVIMKLCYRCRCYDCHHRCYCYCC